MNSFIKKEFLNNNSLFAKKRKIIQTRFLDKTLFFGGMKSWESGNFGIQRFHTLSILT